MLARTCNHQSEENLSATPCLSSVEDRHAVVSFCAEKYEVGSFVQLLSISATDEEPAIEAQQQINHYARSEFQSRLNMFSTVVIQLTLNLHLHWTSI